jgi:two-component system, OmpR family, sensor histidine kinase YxdK
MNKKIIKEFFVDKLFYISIFLINSFILIIFFNLSNSNSEVFYPMLVSISLLSIFSAIEFLKYYSFNCKLEKFKEKDYAANLKTSNYEQKRVEKVFNLLFERYMNELNNAKDTYNRRSHFISQWIHKLKTPISVIELITQKYGNSKDIPAKAITEIKAENDSLYNSVEQVLNIIRLEAFEKDFEVEAIDLLASLRKVINERKNGFIYNKIFPVVNTQLEKVMVLSDSKWNEVILSQVVSNAIKYSDTKESDKKIYFTIQRSEKYTYLSIKDEGVGIPEYDISRIFDPFFTGENGRKFRDSTGIGLYICKEIAKKLGHDIEVTSAPGSGTEVVIKYLSKL